MNDAAKGVPFAPVLSDSFDDWSAEIFEALRDWTVASDGTWTRWDPGYLLLEIERVDNSPVERIILYTADEELTVEFGYWETHLPEPLGTGEADAIETANQAKRLIEDWLSGRIRTAVYADDAGEWCGSMLVEGEDFVSQLTTDWIRTFGPTQVEVRTPRREHWRRFSVVDGEFFETTEPSGA
jgi:hypothetical protein